MSFTSLRDFLRFLQQKNDLKTITYPIDPHLEVTELSRRVLLKEGPALLFPKPKGYRYPLLTNLFGSTARIAHALGLADKKALRALGEELAFLREPSPPKKIKDALPLVSTFFNLHLKKRSAPDFDEERLIGKAVDLGRMPIQTCWPKDKAPLITFGVTITQNLEGRHNLGIYRLQLLDKNKLIMRWFPHRGGALDFQSWQRQNPGKPFPVAVVIGPDPATLLAAVAPIPNTLSEYQFAALLRKSRTKVIPALSSAMRLPASFEWVLEGHIDPYEKALEGPFGDHTGYYNEPETHAVFTVTHMRFQSDAIYHSTYTGRPPDEPALLGEAFNEMLIPLLQKQFPEIADFYLPPAAASYRLALVSIKKSYLGHAKRIMLGIWSYLPQFLYTKGIAIFDDDIDIRAANDVIWALATRVDPKRDMVILDRTPIDHLDFASPEEGLGSKIGVDATTKWPGESSRHWGEVIAMDETVIKRIDALWAKLEL
jgi:4-hydroxy-3-polyprenylbenzoate decarboxylase